MPFDGKDRIRVEFDVSEDEIRRLDEIKERLGCRHRAEVVRRALALFVRMTKMGIVDVKITGQDGTPMSFDPQCVLDD